MRFPRKRDRATRLLRFVGDVIVNGNPEVAGRARPPRDVEARAPGVQARAAAAGTKQRLDELGAEKFAQWMLRAAAVLLTDTTLRDAHQSLLATRMRTRDMLAIAPAYARLAAATVLGRMLGRGDVRRRDALPARVPVGTPGSVARGDAEPAAADAAALGERASAIRTIPDNVVRYFVAAGGRAAASTCSVCSTR